MQAFLSYIQGSLEELRLVRWPTKQQSVRLSVIVLIFIAVSAVFFGVLDASFTQLIRLTLR